MMYIFPHKLLAEKFDALSVEIDKIKNSNKLKATFKSFCDMFDLCIGIVEAEEDVLHLMSEKIDRLKKEIVLLQK